MLNLSLLFLALFSPHRFYICNDTLLFISHHLTLLFFQFFRSYLSLYPTFFESLYDLTFLLVVTNAYLDTSLTSTHARYVVFKCFHLHHVIFWKQMLLKL